MVRVKDKSAGKKIPMETGAKPEARHSTHSAITVSSNDSEVDDYETPGTSAMVTPAAELGIGSSNGKGKIRNTKPWPALFSVEAEFGSISCQSQAEVRILTDQILAQRLQEEEYDQDDAPLSKKRRIVKDSDPEDSALSELASDGDYSEGDLGMKASKRGTRIAKATGSSIRPTLPVASALETESEFNDSAIESESENEVQPSTALDDPLGNGNRNAEDIERNRHALISRRRSAYHARRVLITLSF